MTKFMDVLIRQDPPLEVIEELQQILESGRSVAAEARRAGTAAASSMEFRSVLSRGWGDRRSALLLHGHGVTSSRESSICAQVSTRARERGERAEPAWQGKAVRGEPCPPASREAVLLSVEDRTNELAVPGLRLDELAEEPLERRSMHPLRPGERKRRAWTGLTAEAKSQSICLHARAEVCRSVLAVVLNTRAVPTTEAATDEIQAVGAVAAPTHTAVKPGAPPATTCPAPADLQHAGEFLDSASRSTDHERIRHPLLLRSGSELCRHAALERPGHVKARHGDTLDVQRGRREDGQIDDREAAGIRPPYHHRSSRERESIASCAGINRKTVVGGTDVHGRRIGSCPRSTARKQKTPAEAGVFWMELAGLEPATSWVRSRRSPN